MIKIKSFKKKCEDQNKDLIKKKYRFMPKLIERLRIPTASGPKDEAMQ